MKCAECKASFTENAGRGQAFLRCGINGRVIDTFPVGAKPSVWLPDGRPAWCHGGVPEEWTRERRERY